jgi:hypothetical protein
MHTQSQIKIIILDIILSGLSSAHFSTSLVTGEHISHWRDWRLETERVSRNAMIPMSG